jgi:hypothetical protein
MPSWLCLVISIDPMMRMSAHISSTLFSTAITGKAKSGKGYHGRLQRALGHWEQPGRAHAPLRRCGYVGMACSAGAPVSRMVSPLILGTSTNSNFVSSFSNRAFEVASFIIDAMAESPSFSCTS